MLKAYCQVMAILLLITYLPLAMVLSGSLDRIVENPWVVMAAPLSAGCFLGLIMAYIAAQEWRRRG